MRTYLVREHELGEIEQLDTVDWGAQLSCYNEAPEPDRLILQSFVRWHLSFTRKQLGLNVNNAMSAAAKTEAHFGIRICRGKNPESKTCCERWHLDQIRGERKHGLHLQGRDIGMHTYYREDYPEMEIAYVHGPSAKYWAIEDWVESCAWSEVYNILPASHRHHRSQTMLPHTPSPVPVEMQKALIAQLPYDPRELRGWVLLGPPGTSKTAYASAAVLDMLTLSYLWHLEFCLYRVKVPQWLAITQAYDNRNYRDDNVRKPDMTPERIERESKSPILWLEEIDRFNTTDVRLNYLYRLIDAVYEKKGCIIVTSNATRTELREKLGDVICRRFFGDQDDPKHFKCWDLHAAIKPELKGKKPPKPMLAQSERP